MKIYLLPLLFLLVGCDGPFRDLEEKYPQKSEPIAATLEPENILLTSQHHKGAFSFRNMSKVQLTDNAVFITLDSFFRDPIEIPISSVSGCTCTYFNKDNWYSDLILGNDGIEVAIQLSQETKDWCFNNKLPVITGKQERDWLYNKKELPSLKDQVQENRETFDRQFKQTCMGY